VTDTVKQLKLKADVHKADYGKLPELKTAKNRDVVFLWNGTTSGVRVPDANWIPADRDGITICDATSAAFAMDLPWDKLDVTTFSWQKVLGGEAAHGMIVLSPNAVTRLENYTPHWPLPKIFRMTKGGKIVEGIFEGETINTPSMLALEDYLDTLKWAEGLGGLKALIARSEANLGAIEKWVAKSSWAAFLAEEKATRSNTSVCLKIVDPWFTALDDANRQEIAKKLVSVLEKEGVALDLGAYRSAPPGLRIWCGATVDTSDIEALTPWLDWAWAQVKA
jgi:phosphoserine aminotransferase